MKITLFTYGSRGDFEPFLALAIGLQKAGHTVTLAAPHRFAASATQHRVPFVPLAGDPEELSRAFNDAGTNPFRMVASMRAHVLGIAPQVVRQILQASTGADLLIHSFAFTTGGHSLARHLKLPDISLQIFPMFAPTGDYPTVAFPPLGRLGNYCSHWLATQIFWFAGNAGFKQIQPLLPETFPRTLYWPFANPDADLRTPLLFAYSPSVLPRPKEWGANVHVTGYFFLDDATYQPPEALSRFLEAGPPPVCVSFGSMIHREAAKIYQLVAEALAARQLRAIFLTGWGGWKTEADPENTLCLDAVPHAWLFPRCKLVIQHGGAGTTAAGLRAGIPNIVIPHAADQPFWGRRVWELGAGPAPIPIKKLSIPRLLAALAEAERPSVLAAAEAAGRKIRAETGLENAIRLIEQEKARFSLRNPNL